MAEFISADIGALESFVSRSERAITEFNLIKTAFETINSTLLSVWEGDGADAYGKETSHILENVGGIKDILDTINSSVLHDIIDTYNKTDQDLGDFNRNPPIEEGANT